MKEDLRFEIVSLSKTASGCGWVARADTKLWCSGAGPDGASALRRLAQGLGGWVPRWATGDVVTIMVRGEDGASRFALVSTGSSMSVALLNAAMYCEGEADKVLSQMRRLTPKGSGHGEEEG